jgi:hypothetical protein
LKINTINGYTVEATDQELVRLALAVEFVKENYGAFAQWHAERGTDPGNRAAPGDLIDFTNQVFVS